jgi:hypothetical protein
MCAVIGFWYRLDATGQLCAWGTTNDLVKGWVGAYDNNEVEIVATDDDPSALRGGKRWKKGQGWNLFKLSGNVVRDDGRHEEYALIRFRLAPNEKRRRDRNRRT